MRTLVESHGGVFLTQSSGDSVNDLVRRIDQRRSDEQDEHTRSALVDAPGWWTLALAIAAGAWLVVSWRLRR